jgi:DNA-binding transcriptional ArsR family regulator
MPRQAKLNGLNLDRTLGALADPTRRAVLDALRMRGEVTAGELSDLFPDISRPAVSKHLRVLREAALVEEERLGRHVLYRLPSHPLAEPLESWLTPFRQHWQEKLTDLKRFVETGERIAQRDDR